MAQTLREFLAKRLEQGKSPFTIIEGVVYEIGHGGRWTDSFHGMASLNIRSLNELDFKASPSIHIESTDPSLQLKRLSDAIDEGDI